jgi:hypothetical protein
MDAKNLIQTLNDNLYNIETERSELADGVRVTVPEEQIGKFMRLKRVEGFDARSKRVGDTIVSHIPANLDDKGLGELFNS